MSTYAIGDVQGCFKELTQLLDKINFNEIEDLLWFVGDLVNRGPESLETLRFVKALGDNAVTVLGNHDLHLLAIANGQEQFMHKADTLHNILTAPDRDELLNWLRLCPLLHHDSEFGFTLIHAGLPPQWNMEQAMACATELETVLSGEHYIDYFDNMYGNRPDSWSEDHTEWDRLRFITNCFARMRYCTADGHLELKEKGAPGIQSDSLTPWYASSNRKTINNKIIFGHWANLVFAKDKNFKQYNVYPLDTGCLWGRELTAMRLEDEKLFSVPSHQAKI
ncbi:MAG: symmetrical bis(5'-nucleosyl)-tetraphosphatase [Proteobacteria bacterium]|nr:symmetrical bis(5'-nucleosyl)-tetraphosphatase [Pseudomonadota bacterium]